VCLHADARKIANFVRANLWNEERQRLLRSYLNGPSDVEGFADDYAYLISGLLDLYGASGETQWLDFAQQLQQKQDELFWDDTAGKSCMLKCCSAVHGALKHCIGCFCF